MSEERPSGSSQAFVLRVTSTFQKSWEELSSRGGWRALPLEGVQLSQARFLGRRICFRLWVRRAQAPRAPT